MVKLTKEILRIGICDDEVDALQTIKHVIEKADFDMDVELYLFNQGRDLISFIDTMPYMNYIFLDILMDELSGIEVAQKILERRPDIQIIFVTNSNDYREESNRIGAFNYYLKTENTHMIPEDLSNIVDEFIRSALFVRAKSKELGIIDIPITDIIYIDVYYRYMYIKTSKYIEKCVLDKDMVERLATHYDFGHARVHTVVNYAHVVDLRNGIVKLSNGEIMEIAKRKYSEFRKKYKAYLVIDQLNFHTKKKDRIGRYRMVDVINTIE